VKREKTDACEVEKNVTVELYLATACDSQANATARVTSLCTAVQRFETLLSPPL
jgi:hypothetical protein